MRIDFYEEFPTKRNLEKLRLIKHKARLFIATQNTSKFNQLSKQVKKINKKIIPAYWPIIKNSYWISPFSNTKDLVDLFKKLEKNNHHLLIDLELPLNIKMIFKNIFSYFKNRKRINYFLEKNANKITTAQYPPAMPNLFMKILGLDYKAKTEKSFMWYSSTIPKFMNKNIKKNLINLKNKKAHSISLGTLAKGILGNEPQLSPEALEKDLTFTKKSGFSKAVIYRLGGLNENHINVINKFV